MSIPARRAPLSADPLPATGAWRRGDPVGNRRFVAVSPDRPFSLEGGGSLRGAEIAYETWGELDADGSNAILVCHALTGDSHAVGEEDHLHPDGGWWNGLIGPGRAIDTAEWFVVCANVLGGCQGSTGPSSIDPATGAPYGSSFPVVTIRDMVRSQAKLADHLGIARWHSVIGGSMGGMQALEWAIMFPDRVGSIVLLSTTLQASDWQIGLSGVQRHAIVADPRWNGGDYYDAAPGEGPATGLAIARGMAQITYRTDSKYSSKFKRVPKDAMDGPFSLWQQFQVEGYLDYQGAKLARRFDANSYLHINRAMDLHDVGRGRGGVERAVARITAPALVIGVDSDILYPTHQQERIHDVITDTGGSSEYHLLFSDEGHDAFLVETQKIGPIVAPFLHHVRTDRGGSR